MNEAERDRELRFFYIAMFLSMAPALLAFKGFLVLSFFVLLGVVGILVLCPVYKNRKKLKKRTLTSVVCGISLGVIVNSKPDLRVLILLMWFCLTQIIFWPIAYQLDKRKKKSESS